MINWSEIDNSIFEELVLDYAKDVEPNYNWIKTPPSGDGNKDVVSENISEIFGDEINEQCWLEAKFSTTNNSLSKGQLDPTLVSGYLAGNVRLILFITNGRFSENYIFRARKFYQNGLKSVQFRDGDDLKVWLTNNNTIYKKYFGKKIPVCNELSLPNVKSTCFFIKSEYVRGLYNLTKTLYNNEVYILYVNITAYKKESYSLSINNEAIKILGNNTIQLRKGNNYITLPVIITAIYKNTKCNIALTFESETRNIVHSFDYDITLCNLFTIKLEFNSQQNIINKFYDLFANFQVLNRNVIYSIIGNGGTGKTYIINQLEKELSDNINSYRIQFTDTVFSNARYLCQLFLRINFSGYSEECHELFKDIIKRIFYNNIQKKLVTEIFKGAFDSNTAHNIISDIVDHYQQDNIVITTPYDSNTVFFIEDIHKLSGYELSFFCKLIKEVSTRDMRILIIMTTRPNEKMNFEIKELSNNYNTVHVDKLTTKEVKKNIQFHIKRPICIHESRLEELAISTLHFSKFLYKVHNLEIEKKDLNDLEFNVLVNKIISNIEFDNILIDDIETYSDMMNILDVIFLLNNGIEYEFIKNIDQNNRIASLIEQGIIKLQNNYLYPYHDLTAKTYLEYRKNNIYKNIAPILEELINFRHNVNDTELYAILMSCSVEYYIQYYKIVRSRIKDSISEKKYFSALHLLKILLDNKYMDYCDFNKYEKLWIYFYYAVCLDHCGHPSESQKYYEDVYRLGRDSLDNVCELSLAYEAKSEIFNYRFWFFETSNYIEDINEFIDILENNGDYYNIKNNRHFVNAYLSSLNRKMVFSFLVDNCEIGNKMFKKAIDKSKEYMKLNYEGYANMDYARATYIYSIKDARKLMSKSHKQFIQCKNEKRREMISLCDKLFIENTINPNIININALIKQVNLLREHGYYSEYEKGLLKIAGIFISIKNIKESKKYIDSYKQITTNINNRTFGLLSNIESAYYYLLGDYTNAIKHTNVQIKYFENIGYSYKQVVQQNIQFLLNINACKKNITWNHNLKSQNNECFILEIRIW